MSVQATNLSNHDALLDLVELGHHLCHSHKHHLHSTYLEPATLNQNHIQNLELELAKCANLINFNISFDQNVNIKIFHCQNIAVN